jgi:hypothetical protein
MKGLVGRVQFVLVKKGCKRIIGSSNLVHREVPEMRRLTPWIVLGGVFLIACEGINLIRINLEFWLAYGKPQSIAACVFGFILAVIGTSFLGGFVRYRDSKRKKPMRLKSAR